MPTAPLSHRLFPLLAFLLIGAIFSRLVIADPVSSPTAPAKPAQQTLSWTMSMPDKSLKNASTWTVPFDYDPILMPYIVVQASINGQPSLPFVLDTGTYGTDHLLTVEPWAAKKLDLPSVATKDAQALPGQSGQYMISSTYIKTLNIIDSDKNNKFRFNFAPNYAVGLNTSADTPFKVISVLTFYSDYYGGPRFAGILSVDLLSLNRIVCRIDFQHKLLTFSVGEKSWKPARGFAAVPLQKGLLGQYSVSIPIGTGKSLDFLLDTGSPVTKVQNMAALPLPNAQSSQEVVPVSTDRQRSYDTVLLPRLALSGLTEPNVMLRETPDGATATAANLLGLNLLSRFLVTLDFAGGEMYLKRRSDYAQQIVPEGRARVRLEKRGTRYAAVWIEPGSPAELAGMHIGDCIEQIDGQPLHSLPQYVAQALLDGFQGTTASLVVQTAAGKEAKINFMRAQKFLGHRHALLGVSLDWFQGRLLVSGVTLGSPLDQTLKFNDDLYSMNGELVAKMTMDEAFQKLERPDLVLQVWRYEDKTWQELHIAPLPAQTQVIAGLVPAVNQYTFDAKTGWTIVPK